jgi:hypothetical protein
METGQMKNFLTAAAVCFLLTGCAANPMSADVGFGGSATPSAAMVSAAPAGSRDGTYVGTADVLVNGSNRCRPSMPITNLQVAGNQLRFGGFRATITPDGSVPETIFRGMWLTGQFDGNKFVGHVDGAGDPTLIFNGCMYAINATRQSG